MTDAIPWFLAITFGLGFAAGLLRGRLSWSNLAIAVAMAEGALVAFSASVLASVVVTGWDGTRSREMTGFLLFVPFVCFGLATYGLVPIAVGAVAGLAVSPRKGNRVVKDLPGAGILHLPRGLRFERPARGVGVQELPDP